MKQIIILAFLVIGFAQIQAQEKPMSEKIAATIIDTWPDSIMQLTWKRADWTYTTGLVLKSIENVWMRTGDGKYFDYITKNINFFMQEDGTIKGYNLSKYDIDKLPPGRILLSLLQITEQKKYLKPLQLLRSQINGQPRTVEGGFCHKGEYKTQMWLDGLYMGEPFYAEYSKFFNEPQNFDDIGNQFIWMEKHARDTKTGLLYHAWDESKAEKWADKTTGCSPNFWGRAMGWYGMALVDVLETFPANHPKRQALLDILDRFVTAFIKVQDEKTGLWYQVLDKGTQKGNYLEASVSTMFVYTLAKGYRLGLLDEKYYAQAQKSYNGILKNFVSADDRGFSHLNQICLMAGLGVNSGGGYNDGSFEYYMSEPIVTDDPKGIGAFLLTAVEMERLAERLDNKVTVTLDNYFNNESRNNFLGEKERYHYIWEEIDNVGYNWLGNIFTDYGSKINSLTDAPSEQNLKTSDIFIIVDPDNLDDNIASNYIEDPQIKAITEWVKTGGVLAIFANDSANCDLIHLNNLTDNFGIHFTNFLRNNVVNDELSIGAVMVSPNNVVFNNVMKVYLKKISTLELKPPAKAISTKNNEVIMAVAKYGKGTVFAVGDPWLYNEYVNGLHIPAEYENYTAAKELVKWLIEQASK